MAASGRPWRTSPATRRSRADAVSDEARHIPACRPDALRRSLARILDAPSAAHARSGSGSGAGKAAAAATGPPAPPKGQEYDLDHHLGNKSALIKELFDEVNAFGTSLGGDVTRRIRKQYIGYFRGKRSFFTIELQHQRVLDLPVARPTTTLQPWNDEVMRDAQEHRALRPGRYSSTRYVNVQQSR